MSEISTVLGSVRMRYKGPHNPATEYSFNNLVSANGGSYAYINPTPSTGVPLTDTSHWQQIASVGGQDLVDAAAAARDAAQGYKDDAVTARDAAQGYKDDAASSADAAQGYKDAAAASAAQLAAAGVTGDLRIAFHYNYENDQTKLTLLKRLGFNCIWLYQQQDFTKNTVRLYAFLDRLALNGIRCVVQVNHTNILANDANEIALVNYVKNHTALIGFTGYDEPIGHAVSIASQESFYTKMKALTSKLIFQVDADSSPTSLNAYYTPNSYDVFCPDIYVTTPEFTTEATIKTELFKRLSTVMQMTAKAQPKWFIPVIPLFSGEGFTLPTLTIIKYYREVFSIFDIRSWGAFAFNILSEGYETIENNATLAELALYFNSFLYRSRNNYTVLKPKGFAVSRDFVSTSGFVYDANYGFEKIATASGSPENNILILKLNNVDNSTMLVVNSVVRQCQDANTRHLKYSISYDNITYGTAVDFAFAAYTVGHYFATSITVERNANVVYLKVELDCTGVGVAQIADYIGIESIGYGFV